MRDVDRQEVNQGADEGAGVVVGVSGRDLGVVSLVQEAHEQLLVTIVSGVFRKAPSTTYNVVNEKLLQRLVDVGVEADIVIPQVCSSVGEGSVGLVAMKRVSSPDRIMSETCLVLFLAHLD